MKDILTEIVQDKKEIVAAAKRRLPLDELKKRLRPGNFAMAHRFQSETWSLIAECKLQSPAKGRLCQRYSVSELASIYVANGASMLSVHTDPHFLGCNEDFQRIRSLVELPLLRKDFVIDRYQLYEARMLGADAVLLIARILSPQQLQEYVSVVRELGMNSLVEAHDEADMNAALQTTAEFIGINNRNLKTFTTSIQTTLDLLSHADAERTLISESGVFTLEDARRLQSAGCDGILVGEGLVRAEDIAVRTRELSSLKKSVGRPA